MLPLYCSEAILSKFVKTPVMPIAKTLTDVRGNFCGVVAASLDLNYYEEEALRFVDNEIVPLQNCVKQIANADNNHGNHSKKDHPKPILQYILQIIISGNDRAVTAIIMLQAAACADR